MDSSENEDKLVGDMSEDRQEDFSEHNVEKGERNGGKIWACAPEL